jgi:hypothetical protein
MLSSTDGTAWARTEVGTNGVSLGRVAYGAGKLVVVGRNSSSTATLFTSADGTNWHQPNLPSAVELNTVAFVNGLFLVGAHGGPILTSLDAESWNPADVASRDWVSITYGNGKFLAIASPPLAATSLDGITWQTNATALQVGEGALSYGKGVFVAASGGLLSSANGLDWQSRFSSSSANYTAVTYANGVFVAVAVSAIATSLDGITWVNRPAYFTLVNWWDGPACIAYGNGRFVTMCNSGWVGVGGEIHVSSAVPFLEGVAFEPNGSFAFNASTGPFDQSKAELQASTDLEHWTVVTNLKTGFTNAPVVDTNAIGFSKRFYRVRSATE